MIISHKYKYLFVEIPHTASTAISHELREYYSGESILHKHATVEEFHRVASPEEMKFFVFCSIRNPLDITVTRYFKRKTDHQNFYSDPKNWRKFGGHVSKKALREYNFITNNNADFVDFFKRFYWLPYDAWGSPDPNSFGFIIHYEDIQSDFSRLLKRLDISQVRPIPVLNKTDQRDSDFNQYYPSSLSARANWVFRPFLTAWGYSTPWGSPKNAFNITTMILYNLLRPIRKSIAHKRSKSA